MNRRQFGTATLGLLLAACDVHPRAGDQREGAVLSALLKSQGEVRVASMLLKPPAYAGELEQALRAELGDALGPELAHAFETINARPARLPQSVRKLRNVHVVRPRSRVSRLADFVVGNDPEPPFRGTDALIFSRVAFDRTGSYAVVYVEWSLGREVVIFRANNGSWNRHGAVLTAVA